LRRRRGGGVWVGVAGFCSVARGVWRAWFWARVFVTGLDCLRLMLGLGWADELTAAILDGAFVRAAVEGLKNGCFFPTGEN
jgi:hypothetical protein